MPYYPSNLPDQLVALKKRITNLEKRPVNTNAGAIYSAGSGLTLVSTTFSLAATVPFGLQYSALVAVDSGTATTTEVAFSSYMATFTATLGRFYKVLFASPVDGTVANDQFAVRIRYTTDGTTPTTSSTQLLTSISCPIPGTTIFRNHVVFISVFNTGAISGTVNLLPCLQRIGGTGNAKFSGSTGYNARWLIEDIGGA